MVTSNLLLILCLVISAVWMSLIIKVRKTLRNLKRLQPVDAKLGWAETPAERPRVSVVIPARNEETGIAASLYSVLGQKGVDLEVIVVNDHSTDRTGEAAEEIAKQDSRVRVVHNPELAAGWLGKTNAMQRGAHFATGEFLLFSDADIIHAPGCFRAAVAEMEKNEYDFLTLVPRFRWVGFWENTIVPAIVVGFAKFASPILEDPNSSDAVGIGAFLLVRTEVYRKLGDHEPIKAEAVDDVALAKHLKSNGCRVGIRTAPECLQVRMIIGVRDGFRSSVKGLLSGFGNRVWVGALVACFALLLFGTGIIALGLGLFRQDLVLSALGSLTYLSAYGSAWAAGDLLEYKNYYVIFYPLALIMIIGSIVTAIYFKMFRGSILWRGREIKV